MKPAMQNQNVLIALKKKKGLVRCIVVTFALKGLGFVKNKRCIFSFFFLF